MSAARPEMPSDRPALQLGTVSIVSPFDKEENAYIEAVLSNGYVSVASTVGEQIFRVLIDLENPSRQYRLAEEDRGSTIQGVPNKNQITISCESSDKLEVFSLLSNSMTKKTHSVLDGAGTPVTFSEDSTQFSTIAFNGAPALVNLSTGDAMFLWADRIGMAAHPSPGHGGNQMPLFTPGNRMEYCFYGYRFSHLGNLHLDDPQKARFMQINRYDHTEEIVVDFPIEIGPLFRQRGNIIVSPTESSPPSLAILEFSAVPSLRVCKLLDLKISATRPQKVEILPDGRILHFDADAHNLVATDPCHPDLPKQVFATGDISGFAVTNQGEVLTFTRTPPDAKHSAVLGQVQIQSSHHPYYANYLEASTRYSLSHDVADLAAQYLSLAERHLDAKATMEKRFFEAVKKADESEVKALLAKDPSLINATDLKFSASPLITAIMMAKASCTSDVALSDTFVRLAHYFLDLKHCNVSLQDKTGDTALHRSAFYAGSPPRQARSIEQKLAELAKKIISKDPDLTLINSKSETPVQNMANDLKKFTVTTIMDNVGNDMMAVESKIEELKRQQRGDSSEVLSVLQRKVDEIETVIDKNIANADLKASLTLMTRYKDGIGDIRRNILDIRSKQVAVAPSGVAAPVSASSAPVAPAATAKAPAPAAAPASSAAAPASSAAASGPTQGTTAPGFTPGGVKFSFSSKAGSSSSSSSSSDPAKNNKSPSGKKI
jgi:hypothetical protein